MNTPVNVMVNGLPGKMAQAMAEAVLLHSQRFRLMPCSLCGEEIELSEWRAGENSIRLIHPSRRAEFLQGFRSKGAFVAVDFTIPSAVEGNARFYCENGMPFVLGTTGGDNQAVSTLVEESEICAVVAPNMSAPILLIQAALEHLAARFPGSLDDWKGEIVESHQAGKKDTSGTAKLMTGYLQKLGVSVRVEDIRMVRDPETQRHEMGVPVEYLIGHAYHTYTLRSPEGTVELGLWHNVLGRRTYADGTLRAVEFLARCMETGRRGRVYNMIEVLEGRV